MSKPTSNQRLFVAAYPTHEAGRAMLKALRELDLPDHRLVPREQVHLTLQFIGDVPARDIDRVIESVERSASGIEVFALAPQRLIVLPEERRGRLIACETDAPPALLELQRRLATRLARKPRAQPGDRYLPHLTLCRFRRPAPYSLAQGAALELGKPFSIERIHLMRSTLGHQGAQHIEMRRIELSA